MTAKSPPRLPTETLLRILEYSDFETAKNLSLTHSLFLDDCRRRIFKSVRINIIKTSLKEPVDVFRRRYLARHVKVLCFRGVDIDADPGWNDQVERRRRLFTPPEFSSKMNNFECVMIAMQLHLIAQTVAETVEKIVVECKNVPEKVTPLGVWYTIKTFVRLIKAILSTVSFPSLNSIEVDGLKLDIASEFWDYRASDTQQLGENVERMKRLEILVPEWRHGSIFQICEGSMKKTWSDVAILRQGSYTSVALSFLAENWSTMRSVRLQGLRLNISFPSEVCEICDVACLEEFEVSSCVIVRREGAEGRIWLNWARWVDLIDACHGMVERGTLKRLKLRCLHYIRDMPHYYGFQLEDLGVEYQMAEVEAVSDLRNAAEACGIQYDIDVGCLRPYRDCRAGDHEKLLRGAEAPLHEPWDRPQQPR